MRDKHPITEEPCEPKGSSTVLKTSGSREGLAEFNRATQDAQKLLQINLNSRSHGNEKRILELDIEKCFDRICHTSMEWGFVRQVSQGIGRERPVFQTAENRKNNGSRSAREPKYRGNFRERFLVELDRKKAIEFQLAV